MLGFISWIIIMGIWGWWLVEVINDGFLGEGAFW
jgi:hypothetical protein